MLSTVWSSETASEIFFILAAAFAFAQVVVYYMDSRLTVPHFGWVAVCMLSLGLLAL